MNEDIKQRWVEALRSGQYTQGTEYLRRDNDYCCLGVLCDLKAPDGWHAYENSDLYDYLGAVDETLPLAVVTWAKLPNENPDITFPCECRERVPGPNEKSVVCDGTTHTLDLGSFNDQGHNFTEIADVIEQQL